MVTTNPFIWADAVKVLGHLFNNASMECLDAADCNDDGNVDIADSAYVLGYIFARGPEPPQPFYLYGDDPTEDDQLCRSFPPCETP